MSVIHPINADGTLPETQRTWLRIVTVTARYWALDPTRCRVRRRALRPTRHSHFYAIRWAW